MLRTQTYQTNSTHLSFLRTESVIFFSLSNVLMKSKEFVIE